MKKSPIQLHPTLYIFFFLLSILKTQAQNFDNYTNIKSSGKIPQDFLLLSSSKFQTDKNTIDKHEEDFLRNSKKDFYLESNFMVDELLHNGKVLYNDPIGIYVNKVLATVLANKPELLKKIRVYVVLSDIINAYATNNGIIFINMGLLAKLENEAQLAFILGHEATHFEKNHVLNRYVLNEKIQRKKLNISYADSDIESILFMKTSYAKEQEIEADIESTKLLLGTRYNAGIGMDVMRILASEVPFKSNYPFTPDFFKKDTTLQFNFEQIDSASVHTKENMNADSKTHPALSERIQKISSICGTPDSTRNFFFPEQEFYQMRKTAQFEVAKIFLQKGNCMYALYCLHQLLQENPNNIYLNDLLCKTFYLQAKLSASTTNVYTAFNSMDKPAEIQYIQLYMDQFSSADLNMLAIYFYIKTFPVNNILSKEIRLRDLLQDLKDKFDLHSDDYLILGAGANKIKQIPVIQTYLNTITATKKEHSIKISETEFISENIKKKKKNSVVHKPIDNIIIIDPVYKKIDLRKKSQDKYIASEHSLIVYNKEIKSMSDQLEITDTIITYLGWNENDTLAFQNHSLFKRQIEEVLSNGTGIISTNFELTDTLCQSYNSSHLALMGIYSFHIQKSVGLRFVALVWSAFLFPTFPIGVYYAVTPSYRTFTYLITINSKNQAIDFKSLRMLKFRDSRGAINSSTYYQLLKMKKGK